jgi:hypothetical protein
MFAAKILQKMASPGLTIGEHCINFEVCANLLKVLQRNVHKQYKRSESHVCHYGRKTLDDCFSCLIVTGVGGPACRIVSPSPNVYLMKKEHNTIH